jgi:hypothetical protein
MRGCSSHRFVGDVFGGILREVCSDRKRQIFAWCESIGPEVFDIPTSKGVHLLLWKTVHARNNTIWQLFRIIMNTVVVSTTQKLHRYKCPKIRHKGKIILAAILSRDGQSSSRNPICQHSLQMTSSYIAQKWL